LEAWRFGNVLDKCAAARLNQDGRLDAFRAADATRDHKIIPPACVRGTPISLRPAAANHRSDCDVQGVRLLPEHRPFRP
jgi:hypothetical protein